MQLSDTGVGNKLTVIGQVTRGIAGQGPVDESCNFEHDVLPHRKPVQLVEHRPVTVSLDSPTEDLKFIKFAKNFKNQNFENLFHSFLHTGT